MNKKLLDIMKVKCKDMGLSQASLEKIAEIASDGLKEEATEEELNERFTKYEPILKTMQSEATRWAQNKQVPPPPTQVPPPPKPDEAEPWKAYIDEIEKKHSQTLQTQTEVITKLQSQLAEGERKSTIAEEMKKLGLTQKDMEFVTVPADANIAEYLGKYKQSLIDRGLEPQSTEVAAEVRNKAENDMAEAMLKQFSVEV